MKSICIFTIMLITILLLAGCSKNEPQSVAEKRPKSSVISNFYIIPQNPTIRDNIQIVHKVCHYDELKSLQFDGHQIYYTRCFNSGVKMPCTTMTHTVTVGYLRKGNYTINYTLVDTFSRTLTGSGKVADEKTLFFHVSE